MRHPQQLSRLFLRVHVHPLGLLWTSFPSNLRLAKVVAQVLVLALVLVNPGRSSYLAYKSECLTRNHSRAPPFSGMSLYGPSRTPMTGEAPAPPTKFSQKAKVCVSKSFIRVSSLFSAPAVPELSFPFPFISLASFSTSSTFALPPMYASLISRSHPEPFAHASPSPRLRPPPAAKSAQQSAALDDSSSRPCVYLSCYST